MAEASSSIFNAKATEKLRSPDDLEKYVRVTNPSVWVVLGACVALLLGLLAWGVFGAVSTSISSTGVVADGRAVCFLSAEDVARVHVGDTANVGGQQMSVIEVAEVPFSRDEAHDQLGSDYLVSSLLEEDWAYVVEFSGEGIGQLAQGVPLSVYITTERVAPIQLLLGS